MLGTATRVSGPYAGNGAQSVFPYTFRINTAAHLLVTHTDALAVETVLTLNDLTGNGYTNVTGVGLSGGGQISFTVNGVVTALPVGESLTMERWIGGFLQETDFRTIGEWTPQVHEDTVDLLTMQTQQLFDEQEELRAAVDEILGSIGGELITGVLTSGRIPLATGAATLSDSALSQAGTAVTLTGSMTATGGIESSASVTVRSANPLFELYETDAPLNEKKWWMLAGDSSLSFVTQEDVAVAGLAWLTQTRTGTTPVLTTFPYAVAVGGTLAVTGLLSASNISGVNTGNVTLAGENYLSIVGQVITAADINLSTHVTGSLALASLDYSGTVEGDIIGIVGGVPAWGTITGFSAADGSAATPAYRFTSEASPLSAGLYLSAADTLGMSTNGVERLTLSTTTLTLTGAMLASGDIESSTSVTVTSAAPLYELYETDAALDEKKWWMIAGAGSLSLVTQRDATVEGFPSLTQTRTGITPVLTTFPYAVAMSTTLAVTGAITSQAGISVVTASADSDAQATFTNDAQTWIVGVRASAGAGDRFEIRDSTGGVVPLLVYPGCINDTVRLTSAGLVINESSASTVDVRMESDGFASAFFLDSSANSIGISQAAPNTNSIMDFGGIKPIILPRLTTAEKAAVTQVAGMMVYDTTLGKACIRGAAAWEIVTSV